MRGYDGRFEKTGEFRQSGELREQPEEGKALSTVGRETGRQNPPSQGVCRGQADDGWVAS